MMRAGQWVPVGPFQVCPDHDEGQAVLIYDEQTHELHVPREMGPFRIRVSIEAPYGSISAHYEELGRQGMEALADTMARLDAGPRCDKASPEGFAPCTRALGHEGPCALPQFQRDIAYANRGGLGHPSWEEAERHEFVLEGGDVRCPWHWAGVIRCHKPLGHEGAHRHPSVKPELPAVLQVQQCTAASATHRCVEPEFHVGPHDYRPHPNVAPEQG